MCQRSPNISTSLVLDSTKIYPKQNQKIRSTHERGSEPYSDIEDKNNDKETNERITGWLHGSHLTDNKLLSDSINNVMVYTGKNKDWSITNYKQMRQTTIDGKEYLTQITNSITTMINQLVLTKL